MLSPKVTNIEGIFKPDPSPLAVEVHAMGGSTSQPVDLPALPQQRIVSVRDGQVR